MIVSGCPISMSFPVDMQTHAPSAGGLGSGSKQGSIYRPGLSPYTAKQVSCRESASLIALMQHA